jgi:hypothetical protein
MSMREIAKLWNRIRRREQQQRDDRAELRQLLMVAGEREKRRDAKPKGGRK